MKGSWTAGVEQWMDGKKRIREVKRILNVKGRKVERGNYIKRRKKRTGG